MDQIKPLEQTKPTSLEEKNEKSLEKCNEDVNKNLENKEDLNKTQKVHSWASNYLQSIGHNSLKPIKINLSLSKNKLQSVETISSKSNDDSKNIDPVSLIVTPTTSYEQFNMTDPKIGEQAKLNIGYIEKRPSYENVRGSRTKEKPDMHIRMTRGVHGSENIVSTNVMLDTIYSNHINSIAPAYATLPAKGYGDATYCHDDGNREIDILDAIKSKMSREAIKRESRAMNLPTHKDMCEEFIKEINNKSSVSERKKRHYTKAFSKNEELVRNTKPQAKLNKTEEKDKNVPKEPANSSKKLTTDKDPDSKSTSSSIVDKSEKKVETHDHHKKLQKDRFDSPNKHANKETEKHTKTPEKQNLKRARTNSKDIYCSELSTHSPIKSVVKVAENCPTNPICPPKRQRMDESFDLRSKLSRVNQRFFNNTHLQNDAQTLTKKIQKENLKITDEKQKSPTKSGVLKYKKNKCKKLKLIINVVCQESDDDSTSTSDSSYNETENNATHNMDLSFLDDFNVDEIVDSLKHSPKHKIKSPLVLENTMKDNNKSTPESQLKLSTILGKFHAKSEANKLKTPGKKDFKIEPKGNISSARPCTQNSPSLVCDFLETKEVENSCNQKTNRTSLVKLLSQTKMQSIQKTAPSEKCGTTTKDTYVGVLEHLNKKKYQQRGDKETLIKDASVIINDHEISIIDLTDDSVQDRTLGLTDTVAIPNFIQSDNQRVNKEVYVKAFEINNSAQGSGNNYKKDINENFSNHLKPNTLITNEKNIRKPIAQENQVEIETASLDKTTEAKTQVETAILNKNGESIIDLTNCIEGSDKNKSNLPSNKAVISAKVNHIDVEAADQKGTNSQMEIVNEVMIKQEECELHLIPLPNSKSDYKSKEKVEPVKIKTESVKNEQVINGTQIELAKEKINELKKEFPENVQGDLNSNETIYQDNTYKETFQSKLCQMVANEETVQVRQETYIKIKEEKDKENIKKAYVIEKAHETLTSKDNTSVKSKDTCIVFETKAVKEEESTEPLNTQTNNTDKSATKNNTKNLPETTLKRNSLKIIPGITPEVSSDTKKSPGMTSKTNIDTKLPPGMLSKTYNDTGNKSKTTKKSPGLLTKTYNDTNNAPGSSTKTNSDAEKPPGSLTKTNNDTKNEHESSTKTNSDARVLSKTNNGTKNEPGKTSKTNNVTKKPQGVLPKSNKETKNEPGSSTKTNSDAKKPPGALSKTNNGTKNEPGNTSKTNNDTKKPQGVLPKSNNETKNEPGSSTKTNSDAKKPPGALSKTNNGTKNEPGNTSKTNNDTKKPQGVLSKSNNNTKNEPGNTYKTNNDTKNTQVVLSKTNDDTKDKPGCSSKTNSDARKSPGLLSKTSNDTKNEPGNSTKTNCDAKKPPGSISKTNNNTKDKPESSSKTYNENKNELSSSSKTNSDPRKPPGLLSKTNNDTKNEPGNSTKTNSDARKPPGLLSKTNNDTKNEPENTYKTNNDTINTQEVLSKTNDDTKDKLGSSSKTNNENKNELSSSSKTNSDPRKPPGLLSKTNYDTKNKPVSSTKTNSDAKKPPGLLSKTNTKNEPGNTYKTNNDTNNTQEVLSRTNDDTKDKPGCSSKTNSDARKSPGLLSKTNNDTKNEPENTYKTNNDTINTQEVLSKTNDDTKDKPGSSSKTSNENKNELSSSSKTNSDPRKPPGLLSKTNYDTKKPPGLLSKTNNDTKNEPENTYKTNNDTINTQEVLSKTNDDTKDKPGSSSKTSNENKNELSSSSKTNSDPRKPPGLLSKTNYDTKKPPGLLSKTNNDTKNEPGNTYKTNNDTKNTQEVLSKTNDDTKDKPGSSSKTNNDTKNEPGSSTKTNSDAKKPPGALSKTNNDTKNEPGIISKTNIDTKNESDSSKTNTVFNKEGMKELLEKRMSEYLHKEIKIIKQIHLGKYSNIFKCKNLSGQTYAAKVLKNMNKRSGFLKNQMIRQLQQDIPRENLKTVYLIDGFVVDRYWCFLTEYYPRNLQQALKEQIGNKPFHIDQVQDLARQLISAVLVLRHNDIVHSDIKPSHILINLNNDRLKLCGFDAAYYQNYIKPLPNIGTSSYRAPEIILGFSAGHSIDVWSSALVIHQMATNQRLINSVFNNEVLYKQMSIFGNLPWNMVDKSNFKHTHFQGRTFMKRVGKRAQAVVPIQHFYKTNRVHRSLIIAHRNHWLTKNVYQNNSDLFKLEALHRLLEKMLILDPRLRLNIEFVAVDPFLYETFS